MTMNVSKSIWWTEFKDYLFITFGLILYSF